MLRRKTPKFTEAGSYERARTAIAIADRARYICSLALDEAPAANRNDYAKVSSRVAIVPSACVADHWAAQTQSAEEVFYFMASRNVRRRRTRAKRSLIEIIKRRQTPCIEFPENHSFGQSFNTAKVEPSRQLAERLADVPGISRIEHRKAIS